MRQQIRRPDNRETAAERGYDARWRKAREAFLKQRPHCVMCWPKLVQATVVDHIHPHKGDYALFWDRTNWQPLCRRHHNEKTNRSDGGFGNEIRVGA